MKVIHPMLRVMGGGHCLSDAFGLRPGATCSGAFAEAPRQRWLQSAFAAFVVADANRLVDARQKNLAVADLARARRS